MAPPFGTLDIDAAAATAPLVDSLADEPLELLGVSLLQVITEIATAGQQVLLPPALHPTSPPTAVWQVLDVEDGPLGAFRLASIRVGARAATKSRGYLSHAFAQSSSSTLEALRERWAFPCVEAEISFTVGHHMMGATVTVGDREAMRVEIVDPHPIASSTVYYAPSMNLARTADGPRLVQVDPEYLVRSVSRGKPSVTIDDAVIDPLLRSTWPVSGTLGTVDMTMPAIRFLSDPTLPAAEGTESIVVAGVS